MVFDCKRTLGWAVCLVGAGWAFCARKGRRSRGLALRYRGRFPLIMGIFACAGGVGNIE